MIKKIDEQRGDNIELINDQHQLFLQIRKTHRFFLRELCSLFTFSIFFIFFTIPLLMQSWDVTIPGLVVFVFLFVFLVGIQIIHIWQYLREASSPLKKIKDLFEADDKISGPYPSFIKYINAYLNIIYRTTFPVMRIKKKIPEITFGAKHKLDKRLNYVILNYVLLGIYIFGGAIYLLYEYSFLHFFIKYSFLPNHLISLSFYCMILSYYFLISFSLKVKNQVSLWVNAFLELNTWEEFLRKNEY